MKFDRALIIAMAAALAPSPAFADAPDQPAADVGEYYYAADEMRLRRDIVDIRYYYAQPSRLQLDAEGAASDFVYFGAGFGGASGTHWVPAAAPAAAAADLPADRSQGVALWVDWRPDVSGDYYGTDFRQIGRSLTGSEIERVGVRADVTALLFDTTGGATTAWHVSGALGSTSLSLVSSDPAVAGALPNGGGLLWDIGVGWSSGAVTLNAGYQSATRFIESGGDVAVLSLGADYAILPGLSVFGELNVIDDQATAGTERLGTVIIVGTGLNF